MGMSVTVELPRDIEDRLRQENPNLDADAREAYAVELFRRGKPTTCSSPVFLEWTGLRPMRF